MTGQITLPLWLFVLLALLALWAALDRLFLPGVRWYFRRKVNRVIQEIDSGLSVELPQFKLTRRQVLIDRLFHDSKVQEAVEKEARDKDIPRGVLLARVDRYAREIVPSFNAYVYFRLGYWLAKTLAKSLHRVRLGYTDTAALTAVNPKSSIVFVMNHRSNMDYVLVAFLAAERVALSYAVGEWARVWPLQQLIRSMGAYFVRRNSGDPLYRMVLQRYVQMATEAGVPQAVYPEGGLTVDGRLRPPKLGLLDYMLKSFDPRGERDLVFIPVGINYDRVLEDRTLLTRLDSSAPRRSVFYAARRTAVFIGRNLRLMVTGRWYRFGYACVNFGRPISMRAYVSENRLDFRAFDDADRRREVERVGRLLMDAIARVVPVLPVSLVATVFARGRDAAFSELELKSEVYELIRRLEAVGAHVYVPRGDLDYAVGVGLRMLTLRRIVQEHDGLYRENPADRAVLAYYANAIEPLVLAAYEMRPLEAAA
jgi:glycerol-3-phosphate O-acyltransferase